MKTHRLNFLVISLFSLFIGACATTAPRPGSEDIVVARKKMPQCHQMGTKTYYSPPIGMLNREGTRHNLVTKAKNEAFEMDSDTIFVFEEPTDRLKEVEISVEFYRCNSTKEISRESLQTSCENGGLKSCEQLVTQQQAEKNYFEMIQTLNLACEQGEKYSCAWTVEWERLKSDLNKKCLGSNSKACFAAALTADFSGDRQLMSKSLSQSCQLKLEDACFYQSLSEKKTATSRDEYRMTLINIPAPLSSDPAVKSVFQFLSTEVKRQ